MELRHLRYFVAVAEELHFGRAATRLNIAQPPLSQQIQQLEAEIGVRLLNRTRRRVELTDAGKAFLEEARHALAHAEEAARVAQRAARGEIGRLAVGFVGAAGYEVLPRVVKAFRERFPDAHLELRQLTTSEQVQALHEGHIDAGLLRPPLYDGTLACEVILREPIMVVLPEEHPFANMQQIPPQSLAQQPFVIFSRHLAPGHYDKIMSVCQQAGFSPRVVQEAVEPHTVLALVAAGIGVALLPESVRNLRGEGVRFRPLDGLAPVIEMAVAWRPEDPSPLLHQFLGVTRELMGAQVRSA